MVVRRPRLRPARHRHRAHRGDDPQALRAQGRRGGVQHPLAARGLRACARQAARAARTSSVPRAVARRGPACCSPATRRSASARCTPASATTPATRSRPRRDILEWLAARLPRFGGVAIQTEDEIAALASVLGASFAGSKAMTATSGPGLSLMAELVGLAGMAEIPAVIVDAQRSGPSTGMPTKTEQSDLNHALYGGHGEAPRVVMAPTSVEDCFQVIVEAFNAAEKYQVPGDRALRPVALAPPRDGRAPRPSILRGRRAREPERRRQANGSYQPLRDPRRRRLADGGARRPRRVRVDRHRARRGGATRTTSPSCTRR